MTNKIGKAITIMKHDVVLKVANYGESDINNFWVTHVQGSDWEEHSFQIFDKFRNKSKVMVDMGGWLGITPLYCADKFAQVIAFECDSVAIDRFKNNLEANASITNVELIEKAIWFNEGEISFGSQKDGKLGDSESSVVFAEEGHLVPCTTLLQTLNDKRIHPRDISFIKMDIEGSEYTIVKTIQNLLSAYKPTLYISLHHHLLQRSEVADILDILFSIYGSPSVYDDNGRSMVVSKLDILDKKLGDCVFTMKV